MMFEEMLSYQPPAPLTSLRPDLLAVDLDADARLFFARMAWDIGVLAGGAGRPADEAAIVRLLLEALVSGPAARAAAWRRLYREISFLAVRYPLDAVPEHAREDAILALGRTRQFLRENADIAAGL